MIRRTLLIGTVFLSAGSFSAAEPRPTLVSSSSAAPAVTATPTPAFEAMISGQAGPNQTVYEVQKKYNLSKIAKKFGVTVELIQKVNGLSSDRLQLGQKLNIPAHRFSVVVDKSQNSLILKGGEEVLKTYVVSTGSNNSTPVGVFKVTDKLIDPTWYTDGKAIRSGDPRNILGTRWLGITKESYGIHGTTEPEKLGAQVTAGCVRMKNADVEELYMILPSGTEVTIVD